MRIGDEDRRSRGGSCDHNAVRIRVAFEKMEGLGGGRKRLLRRMTVMTVITKGLVWRKKERKRKKR